MCHSSKTEFGSIFYAEVLSYLPWQGAAESPINLYKKSREKIPVTNIGHTVFPIVKRFNAEIETLFFY